MNSDKYANKYVVNMIISLASKVKMIRFAKFQQYKWYWRLSRYFQVIQFHINKFFYKRKNNIKQTKENFSIRKELVKKIFLPSFVRAFVIVVVLAILEHLILNISVSKLQILVWLLNYFTILHNKLITSGAGLITLFSIIASISSIFIGLYFTTIGNVLSVAFSEVIDDLRTLLIQERVGNIYVKSLAMLASMALLLLGYKIIGGNPGVLNLSVIILWGCYGILCFIELGFRAFRYFDPKHILDPVFKELAKNIKASTINGFRWDDASFQNHNQKSAQKNIKILKTILNLCTQKDYLNQSSLSEIIVRTIFFLDGYEKQRLLIPPNSYWYPLAPKYKSWFFHNASELAIYLSAYASVPPKEVNDNYWMEDNIINMLNSVTQEALEKNNFEIVYLILDTFGHYLETLGMHVEATKGKEIIGNFSKYIYRYFESNPLQINKSKKMKFAIFESYGLLAGSLVLGFCKLTKDFDIKQIDKINWQNDKDFYNKTSYPLILPFLKDIQTKLQFEHAVENKIISNKDYIKQLIVLKHAKFFKNAFEEFVLIFEKFFIDIINNLIEKQFHFMASLHALTALSVYDKISTSFSVRHESAYLLVAESATEKV